VVRAAIVAGAVALAAGCDPEIVSGSYFCGPQMACPDDEVCSPADGTCVRPELAEPFACEPGSDGGEPNEDPATATSLSVAGCPAGQVERIGCLPAGIDVDWIRVTSPVSCAGAPLSIDVRYSVAFAPAIVDLFAADGTTLLATATPCNITGGIGDRDAVCLDTTVPADGVSMIRVTLDTELDCDDACDFMHYHVAAMATAAP
jgi:hypothetical protein